MKKLLVVVDMQKDFVDGSLGTKEAQDIVFGVVKKIKQYQKEGHDVVCTMDTHNGNYLNTLEGKNLPVEHCIKGTPGWNLNDLVFQALGGDDSKIKKFEKPAFGSTTLSNYVYGVQEVMTMKGGVVGEKYDEVELVGLCGNICVIANAILIKSACPNLLVTVDASCIASTTPEANLNAIKSMKDLQINITNE